MEWYHFLILNLTVLLILFCMGIPIAIAFFSLSIMSLWVLMGPRGFLLLTNSMYQSTTNFSLAAIPLFVLLGEILFESRAVEIVFDAVDKCIGTVRARLLVVTIIISTIFGALSGAAMGVAAMLGATILPEMIRRGYDSKLSAGAICAGASIAPIIPPSILCIVVGTLANVSIAKLLISGVIPGLMLSSLFTGYIFYRVKMTPSMAPQYDASEVTNTEKIKALLISLPFGIIIFLIMGLIMLGIATPTESAATGVIGALIVAAIYGRLNFETIRKSIFVSMRISGMILLIMAASKAFSQIFAMSGTSSAIVGLVNQISVHPMLMLFIMNAIPFVLCCFMDQVSLMMILIPIYLPIVNALHFDPIWFWLIMLINITIGGITPPFGYVLFTLKGAAGDEINIEEIFTGIIPFVILFVLGMILVAIFPPLATWLPSKL
jgi:tripartite ATP-independent transporter DctM subunit